VGAAIETQNGYTFTGCNVENAAYPVGTCAESGAISAMIAGNERKIKHIVIVGTGSGACFPCGACRQRIFEFSDKDTLIHVGSETGLITTPFTIATLLPHSFDSGLLP
jgi:cytidine deaminase